MAWVRYDDQFPINAKVTAVVVEEPGALSLHVLANTWSNTTKTPGYVPAHQPTALLYDRALAEKWADVLVRAGLWHRRGEECDDCRHEYEALSKIPANVGGWVFHHAKSYRAPARDRATPGTPADLSEKRRAAGRKGGQASAAKRSGQANEANDVSKASKGSSNSVSPDPDPVPDSASNEAEDPELPRKDVEQICNQLAQRIIDNGSRKPTISDRWRTEARLLLDRDKRPLDEVVRVLNWCQQDSFWKGNILSMPKFREKYDRLRIASSNQQGRQNGGMNGHSQPHIPFQNPPISAYHGEL